MPPKQKRAADGDLVTPTKRRCKSSQELSPASSTPGGELQRVPLDLLQDPNRPWIALVMSTVSLIHERGQSLNQWLFHKVSSLGVNHWVDLLDAAFPPVVNVSYAKAETLGEPGAKKLRLWMLGIHPDSGNSGMMVNDDAETLVQLICVYGFRTEADKMIGVEMLAGKTADPSFTVAFNMITPHEKKTNLAQVHSVWHVKGWKRSIAALVVATVVAEAGLAPAMHELDPEVMLSFCTVHTIFERFDDALAAIWASRSITMASTTTRRTPNCFNHLHQLRKVEILGRDAGTDLTDWGRKSGIMKAFNIGPMEAAAALNLAKHVPLAFVERLQQLVQKYGFWRGPVTHAALAQDCICLGKGPSMTSQKWTDDLKNDEYSLLLLAKRIELDWESTPKTMRKSLTPQLMIQKQLICATFNKARQTLKAIIPDTAFITEMPHLEAKFLEQYLDQDLEAAAQNQHDPWPMHEIADIQSIIKRMEAAITARDRERHREVITRAEVATFEQLSTELLLDQEDSARYLSRKDEVSKNWARKVAMYKAKRYTNGIEKCQAYMEHKFDICDLPDAKHLSREISLMRRRLEQESISTDNSGRIAVLIVLDLNMDHGSAAMSALKPIAEVLQQSEDNCMVLVYPQVHKNFKLATKLKVERTVEDKLLMLGLNLEHESSMHYTIADEHANDRRPLESRLRVIVSNDYPESRWLQSRAARGNLGEAPLVKVRDMVPPASRIKGHLATYRPHPADRAMQRGVGAMKHLLRGLFEGMNFQLGDKLLTVQINVGEFAELPHAINHHMLSNPVPHTFFKGVYINKAGDMDAGSTIVGSYPSDGGRAIIKKHLPVNQIFLNSLMQEWWDTQPESGPKELAINDPSSGLEIPVLRVCTWCGDVPVVADMAASKFPAGSDTALR